MKTYKNQIKKIEQEKEYFEKIRSYLRLFKSVPIKEHIDTDTLNETIYQKTLSQGFILAPEIFHNYTDENLMELVGHIIEVFGLSGEEMNASFHKSWSRVRESEMKELVIEQLIHYFTTYGAEFYGVYSKENVFVPKEDLNIPDLDIDGLNLIIINGMTPSETKKRLFSLLESGIALSEDSVKDVCNIATHINISGSELDRIKNKEVSVILYSSLGIIPENPIEFLRYCVYESIEKTLLIKNSDTIERIKEQDNKRVGHLFKDYRIMYGFEKLAEIFFRFKPIFLAFRTNKQMRSYTNKLRKLADTHHKPMIRDYLNQVTELITDGEIDLGKFREELERSNIFRKIRLAYALKYRTEKRESILYRIRNGKTYAKEFSFPISYCKKAKELLEDVLESIKSSLTPLKGKKVYIPESIFYALPSSEKKFTGELPSGSFIKVKDDDIVLGVHWKNVEPHRIDLDLSLINSKEGRKIGWDALYRTEERNILFSGDMTDAQLPEGASEIFYVGENKEGTYILFINYFTYQKEINVPFKIFISKGDAYNRDSEDFMINPNTTIATTRSKLDSQQKVLGILVIDLEGIRFHFAESKIGESITSYNAEYTKHIQNYLVDFNSTPISLNKVLEDVGVIFVENPDESDVNLSLEEIKKDTIIHLLRDPESYKKV
jgi:hypothetical protein